MSATPHKYLIVLAGPTASGKTGLAIRLAQHFKTEIVSADSRQFFKEMSIGTAKPTEEELAAAPHHFVGHLSVETPYSVGDFERDALQKLDELFKQHQVVILTGGSGLYLQAVCEGLDKFPEVPGEIKAALQEQYEHFGLAALQKELAEKDPDYYAEVDQQNPVRLLRALEVIRASGKPFSSFRSGAKKARNFHPIYLQTTWSREQLYERINQRVHLMMAAGQLAEARTLYPLRDLNALQTVGYRELFAHFDGEYELDRAIALMQQNSRRYAKRQLTWLRRAGQYRAFPPGEWDDILAYVEWAIAKNGSLQHIKQESKGRFEMQKNGHTVAQLHYQIHKKHMTHTVEAGSSDFLKKQLLEQFSWHFPQQ